MSEDPVSSRPVSATVEPVEAGRPAEPPAPAAPQAAYAEAINLASSAYLLGQKAASPDDWLLVSGRWQRAIEKLKAVPPEDPQYAVAQTKLADYAHQVTYAQKRIEQLNHPPDIAIASVPGVRSRPAPVPVAPKPVAPSAPAGTQTIPIVRRQHGTPVIRVVFNDRQTYEMILDTGASRTLLTRAMAQQLGVVTTGQMRATTASHEEVIFETGRLQSISVGDITLSNPEISIGDTIEIGLLGNDFLSGYDMTIRDRENVVELSPAY
ncbi:retroviral-like aspartic protease family protein [Romeria aff. gracilis LEGE 07310]|uniref:Retroviral-like aspartic protease family protein n=1 Tax=Vasconcelosia minhoensis LEGE 07310 TaxID=915328 RepID=A0A8J7DRR3_9CYAN|nr:retropepsin-like aspartic protease [Romeria gracilis]MBE9079129.1 retroviral-like aspartic protease family protein [Romeria aff. gracilis LEGE 07310]